MLHSYIALIIGRLALIAYTFLLALDLRDDLRVTYGIPLPNGIVYRHSLTPCKGQNKIYQINFPPYLIEHKFYPNLSLFAKATWA